MTAAGGAPLAGVRVLDATDGLGESAGRFLAELGADVLRVEEPGGSRSRSAEPVVDGVSLPYALRNAGKSVTEVDLATDEGRARFAELASGSDIVLESRGPGVLDDAGVGAGALRAASPTLVWVSVSGFGQDGPYRDWAATEPVLHALSGSLSRSGVPGGEPLLPPSGIAEETIGVHAAWTAVLAYYRRLRTGRGETVDFSAFEAVVHGFDPGFGTQGSAAAARADDFPRDRPDAANFYPVFPCRDGRVRICLLAKRQWRAMFSWLGEPEEFSDPRLDTIPGRFLAADRLNPAIAALFAGYTQAELVEEGTRRGIPIGGVHTMSEVLRVPHFAEAGSLVETELAPGVRARVPAGYVRVDGQRCPTGAPASPAASEAGGVDDDELRRRPLHGLRVLDLGVIVFGAEASRQLADYGADVIKIENSNFPDGLRQSKRGTALSASVAWGHRNKRSLGLDLRSEQGREIFLRLAAEADVVLANFKPGTLASMGLAPERLAELNPGIVVSESSAFGGVGPWSSRMGYGPLVRASCGVSALWSYPDRPEALCDGQTVYPDHIAAQVAAVAVVSMLIRRLRTGAGGHIEVAQAETALVQLGVQVALEGLRPGSVVPTGNADPFSAPSGVFACAGDDEWCVVTVRDDRDWAALCDVIGRPELAGDPRYATAGARIAARAEVDAVLSAWLAGVAPGRAAELLQLEGVPAAAMLRLPELLTDPQLVARDSFAQIPHALLPAPLAGPARSARFAEIADPEYRQAPLPGEQTREIATGLLGMPEDEVERLIEDGILQIDG